LEYVAMAFGVVEATSKRQKREIALKYLRYFAAGLAIAIVAFIIGNVVGFNGAELVQSSCESITCESIGISSVDSVVTCEVCPGNVKYRIVGWMGK
jgi:F0F1-type ATP synthase membrane subunit c/vacuolar-type H+-ATPase subunit K